MSYGELVRRVRESRSLSQTDLARVSGVSQPNISAIEGDRRLPSAETLNRLLVSCGYRLAAVAGSREEYCDLPRVGWFPDDEDPPLTAEDPVELPPALAHDVTGVERNRVVTALLDAVAP